jgi:uncharacterized RDD family membrane protein YckC
MKTFRLTLLLASLALASRLALAGPAPTESHTATTDNPRNEAVDTSRREQALSDTDTDSEAGPVVAATPAKQVDGQALDAESAARWAATSEDSELSKSAESAESADAPAAPEAPAAATEQVEKPTEALRELADHDQPRVPHAQTPPAAPEAPVHHATAGGPHVMIFGNAHSPADEDSEAVVSIFGNSTADGPVQQAVVSIFGNSHARGSVGQAVVAIFGNSNAEGTVGQDVVAIFGNARVDGHVHGKVVSIFGTVELGPNAVVEGELVSMGGPVHRAEGAVVHGKVSAVPMVGKLPGHGFGIWLQDTFFRGRLLSFHSSPLPWVIALGFLGFYVLLGLLFSNAVTRTAETLEQRPGRTLLAAFLSMLLAPALVLVGLILLVTIIGPFVLFLALFVGQLFGKAAFLAWLGRRMVRKPGPGGTALAILLGGAIMLLLYCIPVLGILVWKLSTLLGFGMVIYTLILSSRRGRGDAPSPAAGPQGGAPVSPNYTGIAPAVAAPVSAYGVTAPVAGAPGVVSASAVPNTAGGSLASAVSPAPAITQPVATAPAVATASPLAGAQSQQAPGAPSSPPPASPAEVSAAPAGFVATAAGESFVAQPTTPAATHLPPPPPPPFPSTQSGVSTPPPPPPLAAAGLPPRQVPGAAAYLALPRAGFWIRVAAAALDIILISLVAGAADAGSVFLLIYAVYCVVMWALKATTVGGIICGLKVVRLDGRPVDWTVALVRGLGAFLSAAVLFLGFIWVAFDEDAQSWHDRVAGTTIVKVPRTNSLI